MKIVHLTSLVTILFLQGCSLFAGKEDVIDESPPVVEESAAALGKKPQNNSHLLPINNYYTTPEVNIIHELSQSGCLIESVDINRSKQSIRVDCEKSFLAKPPDAKEGG